MDMYIKSISDLKKQVDTYKAKQAGMRREGVVTYCGDGIVHIAGLTECRYGELLEFGDGIYGIAFNMEEDNVGAVLLSDQDKVHEGTQVLGSERVVEVPVGKELLGRTVNPLGEELDGKGRIRTKHKRAIECEAPGIIDRQDVDTPLKTGLMAIDSMIPVGRGQRELIIGDRQTGENRHRRRHDNKPKAPGRGVYICGNRAEGFHHRPDNRHPRKARGHGIYHCCGFACKRFGAHAVHCAIYGGFDG